MKFKYIILIIQIFGFIQLKAQDPHIFTRFSSQPTINNETKEKINEIPYYKAQSRKSFKKVTFIDNSTLKFFPPIFNQVGNSCSQASGIRYIFSYEMNRVRNTDASLNQNVYSYHYTWNFLNEGTDMGSWYFDGYNLVKDNGVPSLNDFNDESGINEKTWMTGYDKYFKAIHNRISNYSRINAETTEGLELIKQYLIDHGDGSETGGLINFSGKTSNWDVISYNGESNTGYKYAIRNFGNGGDHAMTIVGFDDAVEIDVNSDGVIQNDEKGALIIANSWGSNWGSNGRAYMAYKLLYKSWWSGGMGNGDHDVYVMEAKDHDPSVVAKINLKYTSRNDLWMIIGVAESANASNPDKTKTMKIIKKQGGDFYMQGSSTELSKKIEIALDYSELIEKVPDAKKFFLTVKQSVEGSLGEGLVEQFSIMDYRAGSTPKEYISNDKNIAINSSVILSVATGTNTSINPEVINSENFEAFPNPIKRGEILTIILNDKTNITKIELVDINGKTLSPIFSKYNKTIKVNIPDNLNNGVYFIRIFETSNILNRKIFIF